jgi:hypothetical protein
MPPQQFAGNNPTTAPRTSDVFSRVVSSLALAEDNTDESAFRFASTCNRVYLTSLPPRHRSANPLPVTFAYCLDVPRNTAILKRTVSGNDAGRNCCSRA